MGYRSDVRIIVSKNGFEKLKEFVEKYLKENSDGEIEDNLLEMCDVKQEGEEQSYFGWNYLKWYDGCTDVDAIMKGLDYLEDNEYSYRYMIIGENKDDVEERFYDGEKDGEIDLEYPSMIREFDDDYVTKLIKPNNKVIENEETIELRTIINYGGDICRPIIKEI